MLQKTEQETNCQNVFARPVRPTPAARTTSASVASRGPRGWPAARSSLPSAAPAPCAATSASPIAPASAPGSWRRSSGTHSLSRLRDPNENAMRRSRQRCQPVAVARASRLGLSLHPPPRRAPTARQHDPCGGAPRGRAGGDCRCLKTRSARQRAASRRFRASRPSESGEPGGAEGGRLADRRAARRAHPAGPPASGISRSFSEALLSTRNSAHLLPPASRPILRRRPHTSGRRSPQRGAGEVRAGRRRA